MKTCYFCKKRVAETFRILTGPVFNKVRAACERCYAELRGV